MLVLPFGSDDFTKVSCSYLRQVYHAKCHFDSLPFVNAHWLLNPWEPSVELNARILDSRWLAPYSILVLVFDTFLVELIE